AVARLARAPCVPGRNANRRAGRPVVIRLVTRCMPECTTSDMAATECVYEREGKRERERVKGESEEEGD
ncbi:unnamed protein product, partial [Dovyalis caffra]